MLYIEAGRGSKGEGFPGRVMSELGREDGAGWASQGLEKTMPTKELHKAQDTGRGKVVEQGLPSAGFLLKGLGLS